MLHLAQEVVLQSTRRTKYHTLRRGGGGSSELRCGEGASPELRCGGGASYELRRGGGDWSELRHGGGASPELRRGGGAGPNLRRGRGGSSKQRHATRSTSKLRQGWKQLFPSCNWTMHGRFLWGSGYSGGLGKWRSIPNCRKLTQTVRADLFSLLARASYSPLVSPTVKARTYTYCKPCSTCSHTDPHPTDLSPLCLAASSSRTCRADDTFVSSAPLHTQRTNWQSSCNTCSPSTNNLPTKLIPEKSHQVQGLLDPLRLRRPCGFAARPHNSQQRRKV